jgi:selenocysteine lyase/cysteine desulfurase
LLSGVLEEAEGLGFTVERPAWRAGHLVGLRVPAGLDLAGLQTALQDRNIFVSLRGSALRVSPNIYNDETDAAALAEAIRAAAVPA